MNLVTACADCNLGKSNVPLEESRIRGGVTAEDALAHADQVRAYLDAQREVLTARDELIDWLCDYWRSSVGEDPLVSWAQQLRGVIRSHPLDRIVESIDAVAGSGRHLSALTQVKYFFGALRRRAERSE